MISGAAVTKRTARPFLLLDFPVDAAGKGEGTAFVWFDTLFALTVAASGHLRADAVSSFGVVRPPVPNPEYFSVDGLRKSTTSSFSL